MPAPENTTTPCPATELLRRIDALSQEIKEVQCQLMEMLRQQPDNPALHRIGPRCFVMPVHQLDRHLSLDPFRYDWQAQFERLSGHIAALFAHPARIEKVFSGILKDQVETANGRQFRYAPEVVEPARPVLESALAIIAALNHLRGANPGASE